VHVLIFPLVLCWLSDGKGFQPVKTCIGAHILPWGPGIICVNSKNVDD